MVNPVAGCYSEKVPILVISGRLRRREGAKNGRHPARGESLPGQKGEALHGPGGSPSPARWGAKIGSGVRPIVLVGDGRFQMTGPELAHAPRYGLKLIVIVLNNRGWGIFRPVASRPRLAELLSLPSWPYADLARAWGGPGFKVDDRTALRKTLMAADKSDTFALIECIIDPNDLSPMTRRYFSGRSNPPAASQRLRRKTARPPTPK